MNLRRVGSLIAVPSSLVKLAVWLVVGVTLAGNPFLAAAADNIATPLRFQIERSRPSKIDVPMVRGEYVDLQLQYFDYGQKVDLSAAVSLYFVISSGTISNSYPARIIDATNGIVGFTITPTNLFAPNNYEWQLPVCGASSAMIRAYGTISVAPSIGYQHLTNSPEPFTTLDFALARIYNTGLSPWPVYTWFTNGQADLVISNLTVLGSVSGIDGGGIGRDGLPGITPTISVTNTLTGDAACTNVGSSTNVVLQFTLPPGPPGTNVMVFVGQEIGPQGQDGRDGRDGRDGIIGRDGLPGITPTISVTNTLTGDAACTNVGSSTNVVLQFTLPPGPQGPEGPGMTNMPAVWDADAINTNRLFYKVGGVVVGYFDDNGLTLLHGSLTLNKEDLTCNVRIYDGSRQVPSITLAGHPDTIGLYGRGIDGSYGLGWSHAGTDVGILCANGIRLINTNAAFYGRFVGDLSSVVSNYTGTFQGIFSGSVTGSLAGAYGYPEPLYVNFATNPTLQSLVITNSGTIVVKDAGGTTKFSVDPGYAYFTGIKTQYTVNPARTATITNIITYKSGLVTGFTP